MAQPGSFARKGHPKYTVTHLMTFDRRCPPPSHDVPRRRLEKSSITQSEGELAEIGSRRHHATRRPGDRKIRPPSIENIRKHERKLRTHTSDLAKLLRHIMIPTRHRVSSRRTFKPIKKVSSIHKGSTIRFLTSASAVLLVIFSIISPRSV